MLIAFKNFLADHFGIDTSKKVLVALSGGLDSISLCHLLHQAQIPFGIAHCNFQLRGEDSDKDEEFCSQIAKKLAVPYHCIAFETEIEAKKQGLSIQLCARNLRYKWLENIRQQFHFDYIATAHHLDDSIETMLYNLTKGCGIKGLTGIPIQNKKVIRPISYWSRKEIEAFAKENKIDHREDRSNQKDAYSRNKIRHHVTPILMEINPSFQKTMAGNFKRFQELEQLLEYAMDQIMVDIYETGNGFVKIDLQQLKASVAPMTILHRLLYPLGFNQSQLDQLLNAVKPGAQFLSPTHRVVLDRKYLIVEAISFFKKREFFVHENDKSLALPNGRLTFEIIDHPPTSYSNEEEAYLDYDRLNFPLKIRTWEKGDVFCPLGMKGKKQSVQDFYTNQKLSIVEKDRTWLLCSGKEIGWIMGKRLAESVRVTADTVKILRVKYWNPS